MNVEATAARDELVQYLERFLVGPTNGPAEEVTDPPHRLYAMGVLYPRRTNADALLSEQEADIAGDAGEQGTIVDDPIRMANEWLPGSMGLSFFAADSNALVCRVWGARYVVEQGTRAGHWVRNPVATRDKPETVSVHRPDEGNQTEPISVLGGAARLETVWRELSGGHLVTVTLVNATAAAGERTQPEDCIYQVGLRCTSADGRIGRYPSVESLSTDPEEEELRLRYRHQAVYAVGHGVSVDWDTPVDHSVDWVATELMPRCEVPALTQSTQQPFEALSLARLAQIETVPSIVVDDMRELIDAYEHWATELRERSEGLPPHLGAAAGRVLQRIRGAIVRMREGIRVLETDQGARRAFALATVAMLIQMHHSRAGEPLEEESAYLSLDYRWYPFQLAYQLMVLPSIMEPTDSFREVVDLLWFPTGGGKTEAYLAVAAFTIFHRRLTLGDLGAGTAVLTRYTLRLLTAQQFQRSAAMICAAERMRQNREPELGREPFSIGLWVGNEATPAKLEDAALIAADILDDPEPRNRFPLQECPWCGTAIVPKQRQEDPSQYGFKFGPGHFKFRCPNPACPYTDGLPVSVVDEDLYRNPPTFLLGTVDKFARLAWLSEPGVFFGTNDRPPPDLIIQDELHLLSGPLGTTVGLYEHAIEEVIRMRGGNPKVIASTATIRRADDQTRALFGRRVEVFPPSGIDESDSFFARVDPTQPGRLYVGIMSQSHTVATTIVNAAAALLQGPIELEMPDASREAYWTLVAYHNSLRELGRSITLARDDVPARIKAIARDQAHMREIDDPDVVELTGNRAGSELPDILARLERGPAQGDAVSVLATTNMLSVGVDVSRLALMLINGQPKTTAEYIQASSRVGRAEVPGLIVTLYSATKPRDRSHYEGFLGYHTGLYQHVEPTSVTPFALPSRLRALHAAFVILIRHGLGLSSNDAAHRFDPDSPATDQIKQRLLDVVARLDPYELPAAESHLNRIIAEWSSRRDEASRSGKTLHYAGGGRETHRLLRDFGAQTDGWETLHSMRNVDRECAIAVLGEQR